MSTLLIRMNAPMQSWGYDSEFSKRRTLRHPTKSAILGMVACALGWDRDHDLSRLRALRFGVLVESEGNLERDYQTVTSRPYRDGRGPHWGAGDTKQTYRWYLTDASSVIGLESSDDDFLETIANALNSPVYATFCGRKAFPAPLDPVIGISGDGLEKALKSASTKGLYVIHEGDGESATSLDDTPMSFSMENRSYAPTSYIRDTLGAPTKMEEAKRDPMSFFVDMDEEDS